MASNSPLNRVPCFVIGLLATTCLTLSAVALCRAQEPSRSVAPSSASQASLAEAEARYRAILRQNPRDVQALSELGVVLVHEGKYHEAVEVYRKALTIDPNLFGTQLNLGLAYFKIGNFRSAILHFKKAATLQPDNLQARSLLGMAYYGSRQYRAAAAQLEKVANAQPSNAELLYVLAESYLWGGEYDKVLKIFEKLQQGQPQSAAAHMLMGEALDGLHRDSQAIKEFQDAAAVAPGAPNVHFGLGYLYWKQRKLDEAQGEFRRELKNDPENAQAMAYLADVEIHRHNDGEVRLLLERALRERKDLRIAYLDLGILDADNKKYAKAVRSLKQAIHLDPTRTDAYYRLSIVYQAMGRSADAAAARAEIQRLEKKTSEDLLHKISGPPPAPVTSPHPLKGNPPE